MKIQTDFAIRPARVEDVPIILQLIRDLATYERAPNEVTATEEQLVDVLFGEKPVAEVLLAFEGKSPKVMAARCLSILRRSRATAVAAGWNGPSSIGMNRRSSFIGRLALCRWTNGPCTD